MRRLLVACAGLAVLLVSHAASALPTKDECINANEAAQSLRTAGRLREAQASLTLCAATSCPGPVRDDCAVRLDEVQRALPTVVFDVRAAGGWELPGARVTMDGVVLAAKLDGSAIAVDPGKHTLSFQAEGYAPSERTLVILEGDKTRAERVILEPTGVASSTSSGGARAMRVGAVATLGVGVAGLAFGTVFGVLALGNKSALDEHCSGGQCPPSEESDIRGLHTHGVLANVGFGVGLIGLAASAVLLLLSHRAEPGLTVGASGVTRTFP